MSPKELAIIGRRLYGNDWQSPLARRLHVHRTTLWRWLSGELPIPDGIPQALRDISERERDKADRRVPTNSDVTAEMLEAGYNALFEEPNFPDGQIAIKRALVLAYRAMTVERKRLRRGNAMAI